METWSALAEPKVQEREGGRERERESTDFLKIWH